MRKLQFLILLISALCFMALESNAQKMDFAKIPSVVSGTGPTLFTAKIKPGTKLKIGDPTKQIQNFINNPRGVKVFPQGTVLEYKGKCFEFKAYSRDCNSCVILWKDRNNDGKVQPKKELKAICKETGKACDIKYRKVKC